MSRVSRKPVVISEGIECTLGNKEITVKGPKGLLTCAMNDQVSVIREGNALFFVAMKGDNKESGLENTEAQAGTLKALVGAMVKGVSVGFVRKLQLVGVGYKAQVQGKTLILALGYSHPIRFEIPEGITIETPTQTEILVKGIDKYLVGQVAAKIRAYRVPEPYKGKGVRYDDEVIVLKEGKKK